MLKNAVTVLKREHIYGTYENVQFFVSFLNVIKQIHRYERAVYKLHILPILFVLEGDAFHHMSDGISLDSGAF